MAAPQTPLIPAAIIISANDEEATVAPAVVEAVAADINTPETGANKISPIFVCDNASNKTSLIEEALITPAIVPVPTNRIETFDIFLSPYERLSVINDHFLLSLIHI